MGWPWGEAMTEAWTKDMGIYCTVTMASNAYGVRVSIPGITDADEEDTPQRSKGSKRNADEEWRQQQPQKGAGKLERADLKTKKEISKNPKELQGLPSEKLES